MITSYDPAFDNSPNDFRQNIIQVDKKPDNCQAT